MAVTPKSRTAMSNILYEWMPVPILPNASLYLHSPDIYMTCYKICHISVYLSSLRVIVSFVVISLLSKMNWLNSVAI